MSDFFNNQTTNATDDVTGILNFRELIQKLEIGVIAVDPNWQLKYYNNQAMSFLMNEVEEQVSDVPFWDSLEKTYKSCFEKAYKKALLGKQNQLRFDNGRPSDSNKEYKIFEDMPLNLLEQKEVRFRFYCEELDSSYSVKIDLHEGFYIIRIDEITDRVKARLRAERNQQELEEALQNLKQARDANPLTGLPGNIRIQETLKSYLNDGIDFALIYVDLDNFKSFNDHYGFDRGDKALLLTKNILEEAYNTFSSEQNFIGHVGGDDFVLLTDTVGYESICQFIIDEFEERIQDLYDEEDRKKGGIDVTRRNGQTQRFGFMTITLVVVSTTNRSFDKYLEMTETAAELKSYAKENFKDSTYLVDRRENTEESINSDQRS